MKIKLSSRWIRCEGSALLMAVFIALVILPVVAVYIICAQNQYQSVHRSQEWNGSLPVVEAGIEEAMAHLNRNCYPNWDNNGVLKFSGADGWYQTSSNALYDYYVAPRRYIGSSYYDVWIEVAKDVRWLENMTWPTAKSWSAVTIRCVGSSPVVVSGSRGPSFAAINSDSSSTSYVRRQVRVEAKQRPFFDKGQTTGGNATGNGQYLLDAFDSMDNSDSFYGLYDPNYRLTNGGSIASIGGTIDLGANGKVYGTGDTSSSGTITNGSMGDADWIESGNNGNQPGTFNNDLNEPPLEEVTLPDFNWIPLLVCNCLTTYTNPAVEYATVQSSTLPTPLPSGSISTNTTGYIFGDLVWPSSVDPALIETNTPEVTSASYVAPSNIVNLITPPGVETNFTGNRWFTNWAATQTSAPTEPTTYADNPGLFLGTRVVTNLLQEPPPDACRVGNWSYVYNGGSPQPLRDKVNNVWWYYYKYTWKEYVAYKVVQSYTWSYKAYNYPTVVYTYIGTNIQSTIEAGTFKYVAGTGYYKTLGDLSLSGKERMLVNGNATIYVTGNMSMSGSSQIVILRGSRLTLYFAGTVSMSGQGIVNRNDNALNLTMYGLPTCKNISISGNAGFTGSLYAPNAAIKLNGGGNDSFDIVGSIVGDTVTANGHFGVHYDINLARKGPTKGYIAVGWEEEKVGTTRTTQ